AERMIGSADARFAASRGLPRGRDAALVLGGRARALLHAVDRLRGRRGAGARARRDAAGPHEPPRRDHARGRGGARPRRDPARARGGEAGRVRLSGFFTAWSTFLPEAIAAFSRERPIVALELGQADPPEAMRR